VIEVRLVVMIGTGLKQIPNGWILQNLKSPIKSVPRMISNAGRRR
jgi:hypothetical protein